MCARQTAHIKHGIIIAAIAGGCLLVALAVGISIICIYKRKLLSGRKFDTEGYPMTKSKQLGSRVHHPQPINKPHATSTSLIKL